VARLFQNIASFTIVRPSEPLRTAGFNAPNSLGLLTESEVMAMPRSLAASSVARCPGGPMALVGLTRTVTRAVVGTASLSSCSRRPLNSNER
jgi:hypothetical protein